MATFSSKDTVSLYPPAAAPSSRLARYRVLSPLAGVHVSPIALGGMSIGDQWASGMGAMDKTSSFELLDAFYDAGGNFIDTACNYQNETSEAFIGEWAEARGIRDQLVIATKYTSNFKKGNSDVKLHINYTGNSVKSMNVSVNASLKKLRTTYIDILYVHYWDYVTSIEEVMNGLHTLVTAGKVLYLGISDTPAWIVSQANQYAKDHGKTPFSIYQGKWNVMSRSFERDIIPMARSQGMALAPWEVLAGGKFRTDEEEEARRASGENGRAMVGPWERTEDEKIMSRALEKVAKEVGAAHLSAVAIAYIMQKTTYVFPILGGRKVSHLKGNIEALSISLSKEQMQYLESVLPFDQGFPNNMIGDGTETSWIQKNAAFIDRVAVPEAIKPDQHA
ncbi:arylalcohol dehydrogenase [Athelia psychrophila]|uniref:Arylalcohol dehydrogenase n=1 Tax=Athelia psychrophila TaxID=1759441 RepID=A0A166ETF4_9AGAM|nr:arylalcohol dehydrogenase [Fibularhizoctonia sp. CBS 109695]